MTIVYTTNFDGQDGAIRMSAARAVDEAAAHVWRHDREFSLAGKIEHMKTMYSDLLGPELTPSLAHILGLELNHGNGAFSKVLVEIRDTESVDGNPGYIGEYDLARQNDPSYWLMEAIVRLHREDITLEEASLRLRIDVARIIPSPGPQSIGDISRLRIVQEHFGYPEGDLRNIFPEKMSAKEIIAAAANLPDIAEARLREIVEKFDLLPSATPAP